MARRMFERMRPPVGPGFVAFRFKVVCTKVKAATAMKTVLR